MNKNFYKSYIYGLTALFAVTGMLIGCSNSVSSDVKFESVDTLESPVADTADEILNENEPKVLAESGIVGDYEYSLEGSMDSAEFLDRGYFLMSGDGTDEVILTISSGRRSTGGYSIEICDIEYNDPLMTVTVKEKTPASDTVVTEAFTCPVCYLYLSALPKEVKVVTASKEELKFQGNYREKFESGNDYIAIFADGAGEIMQKTYVYKTDDGKYRYVNVKSVTESYGSPRWTDTLTGSGVVDTKEEIVEIAKNHNSCGHVQLPFKINDTDDEDYTIITYEELQNHFISVEDFLNGDF